MSETTDYIKNKDKKIYKSYLFSRCKGEWKVARIQMAVILENELNIPTMDAVFTAQQLKLEREAFYHLTD